MRVMGRGAFGVGAGWVCLGAGTLAGTGALVVPDDPLTPALSPKGAREEVAGAREVGADVETCTAFIFRFCVFLVGSGWLAAGSLDFSTFA